MNSLCHSDEAYGHLHTKVDRPPQERFAWLTEHIELWREFLANKQTVEFSFHPWCPGQEVAAELILRSNKHQQSKAIKLVTCEGTIQFYHRTHYTSLPENDQTAVLEAVDGFMETPNYEWRWGRCN